MIPLESLRFPRSDADAIPPGYNPRGSLVQQALFLRWVCPDLTEDEAAGLVPYLHGTPLGSESLAGAIRQWLPVVRAKLP